MRFQEEEEHGDCAYGVSETQKGELTL